MLSLVIILISGSVGVTSSFTCPTSVLKVCRCYTVYQVHAVRVERNHVDCSSRTLKHIPTLDFKEGTRIHKMSFLNNSITTMPSYLFPRKLRVTILDISENPFGSSLEQELLTGSVIGLRVLIARRIGLNMQDERALWFIYGLHSLEELDLSGNHEYSVKMLPSLFADNDVPYLQKLSLALCRIADINAHAFIGINNLRQLDLSGNFLKTVPHALQRLTLLRKLNLQNNEITVVYHGDFNELHCLQELDLSLNLLGQLEPFKNGAFFGLGNSLTRLALHDSHLPFIPTTALAELRQLRHLDISYNKISFMSNHSFLGEYRLHSLDISGNPWVMLLDENMFAGVASSLQRLYLRDVGLPVVPSAPIARLHKLQHLDLSYNAITVINNDTLKGIAARILYFRGNRIKRVSERAFSHYRMPVVLDLADNDLDSLDFVFNSELCSFFKMNITNNGFLCDCQIEKLVNSRRVEHLTGSCT